MRLVLALYLFNRASYWLGPTAVEDSPAADAALAGVDNGKLGAFKEKEWYANELPHTYEENIQIVSPIIFV